LRRLAPTGVEIVPLAELLAADPELRAARDNRNRLEFFFTCTPALLRFLFRRDPGLEQLTYLDADLYFFADPAPLFAEFADHTIAIVEHRFPPRFQCLADKFGTYNVSWVSFRRGEVALRCLDRWREQCLGLCTDQADGRRFGDQKFLDDWPREYSDVVVLRHPGANLALWNLENVTLAERGGTVSVNGQDLLFYHFHGFEVVTPWFYGLHWSYYDLRPSRLVMRHLFEPYIRALRRADVAIAAAGGGEPVRSGSVRHDHAPGGDRGLPLASRLATAGQRWKRRVLMITGLFSRNYVLFLGDRIV
jgi:hypothetical protein